LTGAAFLQQPAEVAQHANLAKSAVSELDRASATNHVVREVFGSDIAPVMAQIVRRVKQLRYDDAASRHRLGRRFALAWPRTRCGARTATAVAPNLSGNGSGFSCHVQPLHATSFALT
jgi:hypothetical protein